MGVSNAKSVHGYVYTCNRYMEHWLHIYRTSDWKASFSWENVVHQLDLMTNLLGTPSPESIAKVFSELYQTIELIRLQIRNEKAHRYLSSMQERRPIPLSQKFPIVDPLALRLLERMLAFDPNDQPSAKEEPAVSLDASNFSLWGSGEWWTVLAAQSMAVGMVMVGWVSKYSDPVMATCLHMVIGGLPLVVISVQNHDPAPNAVLWSFYIQGPFGTPFLFYCNKVGPKDGQRDELRCSRSSQVYV